MPILQDFTAVGSDTVCMGRLHSGSGGQGDVIHIADDIPGSVNVES